MTNFSTGRVNQKLRTRDALLAAAAQLLREGKNFSVADVADQTKIGRATAYCYFPTQAHLLSQAVLVVMGKSDEHQFDDFFKTCADPKQRLEAVVSAIDEFTCKYETEHRTMLRLSLEPGSSSVPHRLNLRIKYLQGAVASTRNIVGRKNFDRLVAGLGLCMGIEPTVVLKDIFGLTDKTAREIKLWVAHALLEATLEESVTIAQRKKVAKRSDRTSKAGPTSHPATARLRKSG